MTSIDLLNDLWNIDDDSARVNHQNIWQCQGLEGNATTIISSPPSDHTTISLFPSIGTGYNNYYQLANYTTSAPVYASSPNSLSKINSNSSNSSSMSSMSSYMPVDDKFDLNSSTGVVAANNASSTVDSSSSTSPVVAPLATSPAPPAVKLEDKKPVNTQLYKTELCDSYMKFSYCPYGNKCQFAHGENELKRVSRPANWRSKPCANWAKYGSCRYGNRCCFKHSV